MGTVSNRGVVFLRVVLLEPGCVHDAVCVLLVWCTPGSGRNSYMYEIKSLFVRPR